MTVHGMVLDTARRDPAATALVDGPSGDVLTYGALAAQTACVTGALRARGFGRGDVLALWAPNVPVWAPVALGAMAAGGAVSPIGPAATAREVTSAVDQAGARLLVTVAPFAARAREATGCEVVEVGPELLSGSPAEAVDVDPASTALLPFSSGTTGPPKPVPLTHANLTAAIEQLQERTRFTPDDVVLALAPFAHIMGSVVTLLGPLCAAASAVTLPRFDAEGLLDALERHRVTFAAVPPPVMRLFAAHPRIDALDLSALEVIACGGAPLAPSLQEAVQRRLPGVTIGQGYGMTETSVLITAPDRAEGTSPGHVGRPSSRTEVRIIDGELHVRGPHVTGDGWLATGDLAEVAGSGELRIVGRRKELIKVNAHQVAPAELEELMLAFPGVEDAAVIGMPDEARGEVPIGFITGPADPEEVRTWLAERVAPYKRLREVRVVQSLPRSPAGKLLRRALAEELAAVTV